MKMLISATQYNEIYSEDTGILISKNISEDVNYLTEKIKKLQAENAKLRDCVEEISKMRQEVSFYVEPTYPAMICIQVLKELEDR